MDRKREAKPRRMRAGEGFVAWPFPWDPEWEGYVMEGTLPEKILWGVQRRFTPVRGDLPFRPESESGRDNLATIFDMVPSEAPGPEELAIQRERLRAFWNAVNRFHDPRARKILRMRLHEEKTLEEIARHFGLSRERIRQILLELVEFIRRECARYVQEGGER